MVKDFNSYAWTSYPRYLADHPSKLPRSEVLDLFGGKEQFVRWHESVQEDLDDADWMIEE